MRLDVPQVTQRILVATGLTVAGCVLMVVFGSHSSDKYEVAQLMQLYANPVYIAYLVVGGAAVAVLSALYWWGNRELRCAATLVATCMSADPRLQAISSG